MQHAILKTIGKFNHNKFIRIFFKSSFKKTGRIAGLHA